MVDAPGLEHHLHLKKLRRCHSKQYNCEKYGQYSGPSDCAELVVAQRRSVSQAHYLLEGSLTLVPHRLENAEDEMMEASRA